MAGRKRLMIRGKLGATIPGLEKIRTVCSSTPGELGREKRLESHD